MRKTDIFIMLSHSVPKQAIYFHLYRSTFVSFRGVLKFSSYRFYTFITFIPKQLTFYDAIANGVPSAIIFSNCLLYVYEGNCLLVLILYPITLLNYFVNISFIIDSLRFSRHTIIFIDSFTSSLMPPNWSFCSAALAYNL